MCAHFVDDWGGISWHQGSSRNRLASRLPCDDLGRVIFPHPPPFEKNQTGIQKSIQSSKHISYQAWPYSKVSLEDTWGISMSWCSTLNIHFLPAKLYANMLLHYGKSLKCSWSQWAVLFHPTT